MIRSTAVMRCLWEEIRGPLGFFLFFLSSLCFLPQPHCLVSVVQHQSAARHRTSRRRQDDGYCRDSCQVCMPCRCKQNAIEDKISMTKRLIYSFPNSTHKEFSYNIEMKLCYTCIYKIMNIPEMMYTRLLEGFISPLVF